MSRLITRARPVAAAGITLAACAALVGTADAHVKVFPDTAVAGQYPSLTFRVPTESASASTTRLEVDLPADHPFGSVSYQPVPGWTATVSTTKLPTPVTTDDGTITEAPTKIVWTASPQAVIRPGQFQMFTVVAGPVPDAASVAFKAVQTYSDGTVVRWDQPTVAGKGEPEHPAPVLAITRSAKETAPAAPAAAASAPAAPAAAAPASGGTQQSDGAGTWFGVGGIALAAVALVTAVYSLRSRRA